MSKTTKLILAIVIIMLISVTIYFFAKYTPIPQQNEPSINQQDLILLQPKNITSLKGYECFAGFNVKSQEEIPTNLNLSNLELEYFEAFTRGAFYGKIKNYKPEMNKELPNLFHQLMMEHKIPTYEHIEADVCLYYQDLYNPTGGGGRFNYAVEHSYCTNSCKKEVYYIEVDLDPSGTFIGYRQGNPNE